MFQESYWKIVNESDDHVSTQEARLDTSIYGSMFPVRRDNPYARYAFYCGDLLMKKYKTHLVYLFILVKSGYVKHAQVLSLESTNTEQ